MLAYYIKNVDFIVTASSEEEAEEAFRRSGIVPGLMIGEAQIDRDEPAEFYDEM